MKKQEDKTIQLSYRGIKYERNTLPVKTVPDKIIGKYRGATLIARKYILSPIPRSIVNLKYRGICYQPDTPMFVENKSLSSSEPLCKRSYEADYQNV
jgi:hypothetical protein